MELYIIRVTKRLTQWDLAQRTGISQAQISLYERGYRKPSPEAIDRIAAALGVDAESIEFQKNVEVS